MFPTKVPVSDDWKGLARCGRNDPKIDDLFHGMFFDRVDDYVGDDDRVHKGQPGEPVGDRTRPFMANDTVVMLIGSSSRYHPPKLFFQRDEFLLTPSADALEGIMP